MGMNAKREEKETEEKLAELNALKTKTSLLISGIDSFLEKPIGDCADEINKLFSMIRSLRWDADCLEASTLAPHLATVHNGAAKLASDLGKRDEDLCKIADKIAEQSRFFSENRRTHYDDAGEWSRHYSNVRMTVATFVITSCVAIIALKADKPGSSYLVGNGVCLLWLLGLVVFYAFTFLTYKQRNRQLKHRNGLPVCPADFKRDRKTAKIRIDFASLALFGLNFGFSLVLLKKEVLPISPSFIWIITAASYASGLFLIFADFFLKRAES
jgi:hypothetical protein